MISVHFRKRRSETVQRAVKSAKLRKIKCIAFELLEPEYAVGQIARIEKMIMQLEKFPEKFKQYEVEP